MHNDKSKLGGFFLVNLLWGLGQLFVNSVISPQINCFFYIYTVMSVSWIWENGSKLVNGDDMDTIMLAIRQNSPRLDELDNFIDLRIYWFHSI